MKLTYCPFNIGCHCSDMPCGTTCHYHHITDIFDLWWHTNNTYVSTIFIPQQLNNFFHIKYSCYASYNKCDNHQQSLAY